MRFFRAVPALVVVAATLVAASLLAALIPPFAVALMRYAPSFCVCCSRVRHFEASRSRCSHMGIGRSDPGGLRASMVTAAVALAANGHRRCFLCDLSGAPIRPALSCCTYGQCSVHRAVLAEAAHMQAMAPAVDTTIQVCSHIGRGSAVRGVCR